MEATDQPTFNGTASTKVGDEESENLELLEELEPEELTGAEEEAGKGSADFFSQDPVELDEPEDTESTLAKEASAGTVFNENDNSKRDEQVQDLDEGEEESVALDEEESVDQVKIKDGIKARSDGEKGGKKDDSEEPKASGEVSSIFEPELSRRKKNRILVSIFLLGSIIVALGFLWGWKLKQDRKASAGEEDTPIVSNPLVSEKLGPFFVPLKLETPDAVMVQVDMTVQWKRIIGVKYKESRYQIRGEVYRFFQEVFGRGIDPMKDKALILQGAAETLNKALGVESIQVADLKMDLI
ncbi:MAG: hypothetical protein DRH12_04430 [Deltaproteobacteria bacterium]|nr:MAG: hypothetical protein DRH12_04430 [Deltaproteobacteria bacterium]